MTLTEFLLARIAEDEADNACYGEGEYETCFRRSWRILAECEAKRRIVARFSAAESQVARAVEMGWDHKVVKAATVAYDDALLDLASVYAHHPDYREEWKP